VLMRESPTSARTKRISHVNSISEFVSYEVIRTFRNSVVYRIRHINNIIMILPSTP